MTIHYASSKRGKHDNTVTSEDKANAGYGIKPEQYNSSKMLSVDRLCNFCYGYLNNATDALCMLLVRLSLCSSSPRFTIGRHLSTSLSRGTGGRSTSLSSALGDLSPLTIQDHSDSVESLVFALGSLAVVYSVRRTDNHRVTDDNLLSVPAGREPVLYTKLARVGYKKIDVWWPRTFFSRHRRSAEPRG